MFTNDNIANDSWLYEPCSREEADQIEGNGGFHARLLGDGSVVFTTQEMRFSVPARRRKITIGDRMALDNYPLFRKMLMSMLIEARASGHCHWFQEAMQSMQSQAPRKCWDILMKAFETANPEHALAELAS